MKTYIKRHDVYLFERLVSKTFRAGDMPTTVSFAPCSDGLQFTAFGKDAVVRMITQPNEAVDPFTLPWSAIKELAAKKHDLVELRVEGDSVAVTYNLRGVPQHKTFPSLGLTENRLPPKPENLIVHPMSIFDALADAAKCVDPDNSRYSLGSICLRASKAQIVSTDGRQALIQDNFAFSWEGDVLCPVSKIFGSKELRELGDTVRIGSEDGWLLFDVGNVSVWLKPIEGKFPQLDQFTKNIDHFVWLNVDKGDADFVAQRLDNLLGKTDRESPVYVDLNGHVAVRGHNQVQQTATELRLTRSRYDGKSLTMPLNRRFLKNAFDFGINRIGFDPDERTPVVGYGDRKTFVIMPLEGDEPKVEASKITVLPSNVVIALPEKSPKALPKGDRPRQHNKPVAEPVAMPSVCRSIKPNDKPKSMAAILEEVEKLRHTLRESLDGVNGLIREIKAQRRQDKIFRDTVASLRKLQNV